MPTFSDGCGGVDGGGEGGVAACNGVDDDTPLEMSFRRSVLALYTQNVRTYLLLRSNVFQFNIIL